MKFFLVLKFSVFFRTLDGSDGMEKRDRRHLTCARHCEKLTFHMNLIQNKKKWDENSIVEKAFRLTIYCGDVKINIRWKDKNFVSFKRKKRIIVGKSSEIFINFSPLQFFCVINFPFNFNRHTICHRLRYNIKYKSEKITNDAK